MFTKHVSSLLYQLRVMENEEGRKEYLVFPPSKSHCPSKSQKGRNIPLKGNGRRIDYILYSDEGLQQDWKLVWLRNNITVKSVFLNIVLYSKGFHFHKQNSCATFN